MLVFSDLLYDFSRAFFSSSRSFPVPSSRFSSFHSSPPRFGSLHFSPFDCTRFHLFRSFALSLSSSPRASQLTCPTRQHRTTHRTNGGLFLYLHETRSDVFPERGLFFFLLFCFFLFSHLFSFFRIQRSSACATECVSRPSPFSSSQHRIHHIHLRPAGWGWLAVCSSGRPALQPVAGRAGWARCGAAGRGAAASAVPEAGRVVGSGPDHPKRSHKSPGL